MFEKIIKILTETTPSNIAPIHIPVTFSCGHQGRKRSLYFDMLSPSSLENYLEFLGTTKCADCAAVERAAEKSHDISRAAEGVEANALRPAA